MTDHKDFVEKDEIAENPIEAVLATALGCILRNKEGIVVRMDPDGENVPMLVWMDDDYLRITVYDTKTGMKAFKDAGMSEPIEDIQHGTMIWLHKDLTN